MGETKLKIMLELFETAEKINRTSGKAWPKIFDKAPIPIRKIHEEAVKETNKMMYEIKEGLTRLINIEEKANIIRRIEPDYRIGVPALTLHGHELKELVKNDQYYKLTQKPKLVFFSHYHRLLAFEEEGVVVVICGCFVKTHPCYEYTLMPSLGFATFCLDKKTTELRIDIHRL